MPSRRGERPRTTPLARRLRRGDRGRHGRYSITVKADRELNGCGATYAEVFLWTYAKGRIIRSTAATAWPGNGKKDTFDASFSSDNPDGGATPVASFFGDVRARNGRPMPAGTRIEAYVGATLCGVASTARSGSFSGYVLYVVGPEAVPGCKRPGTVAFRIDGRPAAETAPNDVDSGQTRPDAFELHPATSGP